MDEGSISWLKNCRQGCFAHSFAVSTAIKPIFTVSLPVFNRSWVEITFPYLNDTELAAHTNTTNELYDTDDVDQDDISKPKIVMANDESLRLSLISVSLFCYRDF